MRGRSLLSFPRLIGAAFVRDEKGAVIIMAALLVPVLLLASLGTTTIMMALAKRKELTAITQAACNRGVKTLRIVENDDEDRRMRALTLFDNMASERGLTITSRRADLDPANWLYLRVRATASIPIIPGYGNQIALKAHADEICQGIPPYPQRGEVVLSSNFKTPGGAHIVLPNPHPVGRWGVFTAQAVGWDGGTGSGIEIQEWKNGFLINYTDVAYLPPGVSSTFVVELDSGQLPGGPSAGNATCGVQGPGYNSSMFKNFELHPGTYRLSMWNRARVKRSDLVVQPGPEPGTGTTNKIVAYLEGTRPVSPKTAVIVWDDYDTSWRQRFYDFTVTSYGLYKLHVAAEGCSDGSGGLFNDLKLTYIKRPSPEYNDPTPPAPTN